MDTQDSTPPNPKLLVSDPMALFLKRFVSLTAERVKKIDCFPPNSSDIKVEDPMLFPSAPGHKPDSDPFQHYDGNLDGDSWKAEKDLQMKDPDRLFGELNSSQKILHPIEMGDGFDHDSSTLNGRINELKYTVRDPLMNVVQENIPGLYTDKNVTECELPQLINCYDEIDDHIVKDICVDEGVTSKDKILFENRGSDYQGNEGDDTSLLKGKSDFESPHPSGLISFDVDGCDKDVSTFIPDEAIQTDEKEEEMEEEIGSVAEENVLLRDLLLLEKSNPEVQTQEVVKRTVTTGQLNADSSNERTLPGDVHLAESLEADEHMENGEGKANAIEKSIVGASNGKIVQLLVESTTVANNDPMSCDGLEDRNVSSGYEQPAIKMTSEGESSASNAAVINPSSCVAKLLYDSHVESGRITFNFDSSVPASTGRVDEPLNVGFEQLHGPTSTSRSDTENFDNLPVPVQLQRDYGETSFASVGPFSGVITYSGPIAYSGSLSHRSDGSTSTRSFAFPVLQSEFNSPERMAKADRHRFRKHWSWRKGLLCCRF